MADLCADCMRAGSKALLQAIFAARCAGKLREALPSTFVTVRGLVAHAALIGERTVGAIEGTNRSRELVDLRRAVAWVAREATNLSYPVIGLAVGGRDHSTMINLRRTGEHRVEHDKAFAALAERVWAAGECAPFGPGPQPWFAPEREDRSGVRRRRGQSADDEGEGGESDRAKKMAACSRELITALHREHPERVPSIPPRRASRASVRAGYCREAIA